MLNSHHLLIENQWLMAVRTQIFPEPLSSPCTVPHLKKQASQKSASLHKAGMWNTFISRSGLSKIPEMNSQAMGAIGKQVHRKVFKCQFYLQNPRAGLFLKVGRMESVVAVYALEKQTSKKKQQRQKPCFSMGQRVDNVYQLQIEEKSGTFLSLGNLILVP